METLNPPQPRTLADYKEAINSGIALYVAGERERLAQDSHLENHDADRAFLGMLNAEGQRIRGALTIVGYEMMGGENSEIASKSALAMEMIQTDLVIQDDIHDNGEERRGVDCVHRALGLAAVELAWDNPVSLAKNRASLVAQGEGGAKAGQILLSLPIESDRKAKALDCYFSMLVKTRVGQDNDMVFSASRKNVSEEQIYRVMEDKTACYTIEFPLQLGMTLAGASDEDLKLISKFSKHAGVTFQLYNDIKDIDDDLQEGKKTIPIIFGIDAARHKLADELNAAQAELVLLQERFKPESIDFLRHLPKELIG